MLKFFCRQTDRQTNRQGKNYMAQSIDVEGYENTANVSWPSCVTTPFIVAKWPKSQVKIFSNGRDTRKS